MGSRHKDMEPIPHLLHVCQTKLPLKIVRVRLVRAGCSVSQITYMVCVTSAPVTRAMTDAAHVRSDKGKSKQKHQT